MDGGLESHCVGRVCGADVAVRFAQRHNMIPNIDLTIISLDIAW